MSNNNNGTAGPGAQQNAPKGLRLEVGLMKNGVDQSLTAAGISVAGAMVSQAALDTELGNTLALFKAVDDAKAQQKAAHAALTAAIPAARARYAQLKTALMAAFPPGSPVLATFGIAPRKARAPLTSAQKALAAAKAKSTRAARGTMGKKAKQAIVGAVPTVTIGPSGTTVAAGTPAAGPSTLPGQK